MRKRLRKRLFAVSIGGRRQAHEVISQNFKSHRATSPIVRDEISQLAGLAAAHEPNDPGCRRARRHQGGPPVLPRAIATLPVLRNAHCQRSFNAPCCAATNIFGGRLESRRSRLGRPTRRGNPSRARRRPLCANAQRSTASSVAAKIEAEQHAAHGLAWLATYVEAIKELAGYAAAHAARKGDSARPRTLLTRIGLGEYLAQIFGGIAMNQGEIVRLDDFGLDDETVAPLRKTGAVATLIARRQHRRQPRRGSPRIIAEAHEGAVGDPGLDETFEAIRTEMRRFADAEVVPHAQDWHRSNAYIPLEVIKGLSDMGVFGLTIPEAYGGLGLGKVAMCVVSEELSRGYIGVGSLGTRSEIAAELILVGGTEEQKQKYLPKIASGEILPTAVFTEPNTGSDLASLRTRATREGDNISSTATRPGSPIPCAPT